MAQTLYFADQFHRIDQAYSAWHRANSLRRFVGEGDARKTSMIDLDAIYFCEYSEVGRIPLVLVESAVDVGQKAKTATVLKNLARMAGIPAYVVLYKPDRKRNPDDPRWPDIQSFRIKRLWPKPDRDWRLLTPRQFAEGLLAARTWSVKELAKERFPELRAEAAQAAVSNMGIQVSIIEPLQYLAINW